MTVPVAEVARGGHPRWLSDSSPYNSRTFLSQHLEFILFDICTAHLIVDQRISQTSITMSDSHSQCYHYLHPPPPYPASTPAAPDDGASYYYQTHAPENQYQYQPPGGHGHENPHVQSHSPHPYPQYGWNQSTASFLPEKYGPPPPQPPPPPPQQSTASLHPPAQYGYGYGYGHGYENGALGAGQDYGHGPEPGQVHEGHGSNMEY